MQRRLGLDAELLEPEEVARRFAVLRTDDLTAAAFCGSDGYLEPHTVLTAFAATARAAGVRIETEIEVKDLLWDGDAVAGVRTTAGDVRAGHTVNAAGPFGGRIAEMAGLSLPLNPCRRQIFTVVVDTPSCVATSESVSRPLPRSRSWRLFRRY